MILDIQIIKSLESKILNIEHSQLLKFPLFCIKLALVLILKLKSSLGQARTADLYIISVAL